MLLILLLLIVIGYLCLRIVVNRKSDSVACLVGKTAIVTGGNSGLGYATSLLLASRGCRVIIADRDDAQKSRDEIIEATGNTEIFYKHLDLSSLKQVREFAEDVKKTEPKIDILINNAGIAAAAKRKTEDGLNTVMQVNYFGAFLLTHLLLDLLKSSKSARVVFLSSITMFRNNLNLDNLNDVGSGDTLSHANDYYNSKLCNILAAQEFGRKLEKYGIMVNSADPGAVRTRIFQKVREVISTLDFNLMAFFSLLIFGQDSMSGAQTIFHLATSEKLKNKTAGHYAYFMPWFKPSVLNDRTFCEGIWKQTEELVNLKDEKL